MTRLELLPVPLAVAQVVTRGAGLDAALGAVGLTRVGDWPHDDTADALRPLAEQPDQTGEGTFLVVRQEDRAVVGDCGWFGPPDGDGEVEIGYGLAASVRRQGLGTEAVGLLLAWVSRQPRVLVTRAEVQVGNEPSRRLLVRLGFVETGLQHGHRVLLRGGRHLAGPADTS